MSKEMTYLDVRRAFVALQTLVGGRIQSETGTGSFVPKLPFAVILKVKRMLGVLTPLVEDLNEQERKIAEGFPGWDGSFSAVPAAAVPMFNELHNAKCRIGTDFLTSSDFSTLGDVPLTFAGVLVDLGPLFQEEPVEETKAQTQENADTESEPS